MDLTVNKRSRPEQKWPQTIWIVRHGQSAGNVARDAAEAAGLPLIDIMTRDVDTPLSDLGREQAQALGRWFGEMGEDQRPTVVLCSPYVRARETALIMLSGVIAGLVARGAPMEQATAWGVALHARAGSKLAERCGPLGYLARELAAEVPALMAALRLNRGTLRPF
jgi:hypothetical protein